MATLVFMVAAATAPSQATTMPHWFSCERRDVAHEQCRVYAMPKHRRERVHGWWERCRQRCVIFPRFRRAVRHAYRQVTRAVRSLSPVCYRVTGYYPGGITADGSAAVPGVVANNWLPFGVRVTVPALSISGVVHDRIGAGTDFDFVSTNPYALTGCYRVVIG